MVISSEHEVITKSEALYCVAVGSEVEVIKAGGGGMGVNAVICCRGKERDCCWRSLDLELMCESEGLRLGRGCAHFLPVGQNV